MCLALPSLLRLAPRLLPTTHRDLARLGVGQRKLVRAHVGRVVAVDGDGARQDRADRLLLQKVLKVVDAAGRVGARRVGQGGQEDRVLGVALVDFLGLWGRERGEGVRSIGFS